MTVPDNGDSVDRPATMTYRDSLLGRLDHQDDTGHDDTERPDGTGLEDPRVPDEQRFSRQWDEATRFAWQTSPASRESAHRLARIARQNLAAGSTPAAA